VKFDDATAAPIDQIKSGDQLRARGQRSADGGELTADEVVSGSFRNISGTINSIDAGAKTITVEDLVTKKPVVVKIADTSQLRKLPAPMAQRIAARLKGGAGDSAGSAPAATPAGGTANAGNAGTRTPAGGSALEQNAGNPTGQGGAAGGAAGGPGGSRAGAGAGGQGGDLQQAITKMPASNLSDLQKGDAVMIVATGSNSADGTGSVVAITLLSGVEPILQASPSGQSILTPWTMSGAPGGDAAQ
jgi:hypothetical protein